MRRCFACMKEYKKEYDMCPYCGHEADAPPKQMYFLSPGMVIADRYEIGVDVGEGGFGITYKAWDRQLMQVVAIKEYYPSGMVNRMPGESKVLIYDRVRKDFYSGKERFLEEAQNMAKYDKHPNIVNVFDYFEENSTAYIVMEYLDGINYKEYMKQLDGKVSIEQAIYVTKAMLAALTEVHKYNILHRDISPDNIFICKDGRVKLIDFGAARFSSVEDARTRSIVLKRGFAPPEQYQTKSKQGPWTDIYALGATLYRAVTGVVPEESVNRTKEDLLIPPKELRPELTENLNNVILRSMALQPELRFQNSAEFLKALESTGKILDVKKELKRRKRIRILTLLGVCAVMAVGAVFCLKTLNDRKMAAGELKDATVSIWVEVENGQTVEKEKQIFEQALSEFRQEYPQITLDIQYYQQDEYVTKVQQAVENNTLPTLLESDGLSEAQLEHFDELSAVLKSVDNSKYYFLEKYSDYYPAKKQMPTAFSVPIIYRSTISEAGSDIEQLVQAGNYVVTANNYLTYHNLYGGNGSFTDWANMQSLQVEQAANICEDDINEFINGDKGLLIADITNYATVQENMAGIYEICLPRDAGAVGRFEECFSISKGVAKEEKAAALQILVYLLADSAQDVCFVQNGQYLPLNRSVLDSYIAVNNELAEIKENVDVLLMPGEKQAEVDAWYKEQKGKGIK